MSGMSISQIGSTQLDSFDVCIVGTGLQHSILAAALAHNGVRVLHIDPNRYYGGNESTMQDGQYHYDLIPQVLYSNGELIKLLVQTDVCRYIEFHLVPNLFVLSQDLYQVPLTKEDIFSDQSMQLIDKRRAMKLMELLRQDPKGSLEDLAEDAGLQNSPVVQALCSAVLMQGPSKELSLEVKQRVRKFVESVGKYGKSPFLYPLYGIAELPQAFCRSCAVNGGVYVLGYDKIAVDGQSLKLSIDEQNVEFTAKVIVEETGAQTVIQRAFYYLSANPQFNDEDHDQHTLIFVEDGVQAMITASSAQTSPEGCSILNLWASIDVNLDNVASRILAKVKNEIRVLGTKKFEVQSRDNGIFYLDEAVKLAHAQFDELSQTLDIKGEFFE